MEPAVQHFDNARRPESVLLLNRALKADVHTRDTFAMTHAVTDWGGAGGKNDSRSTAAIKMISSLVYSAAVWPQARVVSGHLLQLRRIMCREILRGY